MCGSEDPQPVVLRNSLRSAAVVCCAVCSTDLLALPTCDPDKVFGVQISHEETLVSGPVAYVQCALLYTNSNGERRIRCAPWQLEAGLNHLPANSTAVGLTMNSSLRWSGGMGP
eukprot:GHRR01024708.1.p1 GENE.GHRR01024708.1~~GHRR01024708.1.p1  ORF type:complete len:114 (+),score=19.49 GHRR01024708.1:60-401(+)